MLQPSTIYPSRNFRLPSDIPTAEAKWCAYMWNLLERSYKNESNFIYYIGSAPHNENDSLMSHFNSIYRGVLGGGAPPEPGSRPSSWPRKNSTGIWGKWFPQELLVDDIGRHLSKVQKTARRKTGLSWKLKRKPKNRVKRNSNSSQASNESDCSESVTAIVDSEYSGSTGASEEGD